MDPNESQGTFSSNNAAADASNVQKILVKGARNYRILKHLRDALLVARTLDMLLAECGLSSGSMAAENPVQGHAGVAMGTSGVRLPSVGNDLLAFHSASSLDFPPCNETLPLQLQPCVPLALNAPSCDKAHLFGADRSPAFGGNLSPAFGADRSPAFGSELSPAFAPQVGISSDLSPAFGASKSTAFGVDNLAPFGAQMGLSSVGACLGQVEGADAKWSDQQEPEESSFHSFSYDWGLKLPLPSSATTSVAGVRGQSMLGGANLFPTQLGDSVGLLDGHFDPFANHVFPPFQLIHS